MEKLKVKIARFFINFASIKTVGYFLKWWGYYLSGDDSLASSQELLDRARSCNECLLAGKCVDCGCNFDNMVKVRKPCKRYKP